MAWPAEVSAERYPGRVRRDISVETEVVGGRVVFTATLRDRWHDPDTGAAEDIHSYDLRLETEPPDLVVAAVEVTPGALPFPECPSAALAAQRLVGQTLSKGFREQAIAALGHVEGCTHLLTLVLAVWSQQVVGGYLRSRPEGRATDGNQYLPRVDVCSGWREGGTAVALVRAKRPLPPSQVQRPPGA